MTWWFLVETMGIEPTTPCLQSRCSSQLSYVPARVATLPARTGGHGVGRVAVGGPRRGSILRAERDTRVPVSA